MQLSLIDLVSQSGSRGQANEDAAGSNGRAAWVIDGATDLGPPDLMGRSGAAWLSNEVNSAFHNQFRSPAPTAELIENTLIGVRERFDREKRRDPVDRWELPFAAFMMIRQIEGRLELS